MPTIKLIFCDNREYLITHLEACNLDIYNRAIDIVDDVVTELPIKSVSYDDFMYFYPLIKILGDITIDMISKLDKLKEIIGEDIVKVIKYYEIADYLGCYQITYMTVNIIEKNIQKINEYNDNIIPLLIEDISKQEKDIITRYIYDNYSRDEIKFVYMITDNMKPFIIERFFKPIEDKGLTKDDCVVYKVEGYLHALVNVTYSEIDGGIKKNKYNHNVLDLKKFV